MHPIEFGAYKLKIETGDTNTANEAVEEIVFPGECSYSGVIPIGPPCRETWNLDDLGLSSFLPLPFLCAPRLRYYTMHDLRGDPGGKVTTVRLWRPVEWLW